MADRVSIIIPNWNGKSYLTTCLPAVFAQTYPDFEVVIVDNASADGSVEWLRSEFPQVKLIANDRNLGFASANNLAIQATSAAYIATLNNDTQVEADWLKELVKGMSLDPQVGMVASKILYSAAPHVIDSAGIEVSRTGLAWNRRNRTPEDPLEVEPYEVFGPSAAAALYRRTMLDEVGLFDESYFAYYEDVDLAWRARLLGWRCLYVPTARVYHVHSATSRQGSPFKRYFLARNKVWTTLKNYPAPAVWFNLPIILLYDLVSDFYRMVLERNVSPVHGQMVALGRLPAVLRQRKAIQRRRRISWNTLREAMIPPPNLLKSLWQWRRVG
jgi:hypothetical protein